MGVGVGGGAGLGVGAGVGRQRAGSESGAVGKVVRGSCLLKLASSLDVKMLLPKVELNDTFGRRSNFQLVVCTELGQHCPAMLALCPNKW